METLARKGLIRFEKSTNYRQTFGVKVVNLAWGMLQYRCRSMRKRAIDCIHSALYIVFGRKLIHEIEFVPDNVKRQANVHKTSVHKTVTSFDK